MNLNISIGNIRCFKDDNGYLWVNQAVGVVRNKCSTWLDCYTSCMIDLQSIESHMDIEKRDSPASSMQQLYEKVVLRMAEENRIRHLAYCKLSHEISEQDKTAIDKITGRIDDQLNDASNAPLSALRK